MRSSVATPIGGSGGVDREGSGEENRGVRDGPSREVQSITGRD